MQITEAQFKAAFPRCQLPQEFTIALNNAFKRYDLGGGRYVLAAFLAQCGQECADFTVFSENLNYRAETLLKLWPKHFNRINVGTYAHKPSQIASRAYANRMGNGPESSGDGWRYRGRGILQLTGRENYTKFNAALQWEVRTGGGGNLADVLKEPDLLATSPRYAVLSGLWYWCEFKKLQRYGTDMVALTKAINGGTHGLDQRIKRFERLKAIL